MPEPGTRGARILRAPDASGGNHGDAVDGAGRHAQLAPGAQGGQHRVHPLRGADDRVDGTRVDAQRAADARILVDSRNDQRAGLAAGPVERDGRASGERRQRGDERVPAGRAAIDRCAAGHGLGVRPAAVVAAAPALGLRQGGVQPVGER